MDKSPEKTAEVGEHTGEQPDIFSEEHAYGDTHSVMIEHIVVSTMYKLSTSNEEEDDTRLMVAIDLRGAARTYLVGPSSRHH